MVQDRYGQPIVLVGNATTPRTTPFPSGVQYDASLDRLQCSELSCQGWSIANCLAVECVGEKSCQDATFWGDGTVQCRGPAACQDAWMQQLQTSVLCVGSSAEDVVDQNDNNNHNNDKSKHFNLVPACHRATMQTDQEVLCLGPNACGTILRTYDEASFLEGEATVLQLGAVGRVHCAGGHGQPSCQNLIVQINHGRRACFTHPDEVMEQKKKDDQDKSQRKKDEHGNDNDNNDGPVPGVENQLLVLKGFRKTPGDSETNPDTSGFLKSATSDEQRQHCAVLCDNADTDCDFDTIEFQVT
ncbi:hypothetical protein ACA910_000103 [Epithemia clementina (nom. ined.)]